MDKIKGIVTAILFFLLLPAVLEITTALEDAAVDLGISGVNAVVMSWFSFAVILCFILGVILKFRNNNRSGGNE